MLKNPKVLKKNAVIHYVGKRQSSNTQKGELDMYAMWPGCYSFRDEIKIFALWLKEQMETLILKIYEFDRLING